MAGSPHFEGVVVLVPTECGGRSRGVHTGYRGQFHLHGDLQDLADVLWTFLPGERELVPGETSCCLIEFFRPELHTHRIEEGDQFEIREGRRVVGVGRIVKSLAT